MLHTKPPPLPPQHTQTAAAKSRRSTSRTGKRPPRDARSCDNIVDGRNAKSSHYGSPAAVPAYAKVSLDKLRSSRKGPASLGRSLTVDETESRQYQDSFVSPHYIFGGSKSVYNGSGSGYAIGNSGNMSPKCHRVMPSEFAFVPATPNQLPYPLPPPLRLTDGTGKSEEDRLTAHLYPKMVNNRHSRTSCSSFLRQPESTPFLAGEEEDGQNIYEHIPAQKNGFVEEGVTRFDDNGDEEYFVDSDPESYLGSHSDVDGSKRRSFEA